MERTEKNKIVIYTCLFGLIDSLQDPLITDPKLDYICFTNRRPKGNIKKWRIIYVTSSRKNNHSNSRRYKFLAHKYLDNYDYSFYIDANIKIVSNSVYERIFYLQNNQIGFALNAHPKRNCIYTEAELCLKEGYDSKQNIKKTITELKKNNYPENYGLFENNMIWRSHKTEKINSLMDIWWEYYQNYSKRDQLTLVYLCWKMNIKPSKLFKEDIDPRSNEMFIYSFHKRSNKRLFFLIKHFFNRISNRFLRTFKQTE